MTDTPTDSRAAPTVLHRDLINWISVDVQLPDSNITVLIFAPDMTEPVWLGYHEDDTWHTVEADEIEDGQVKAWAEMPMGPAE